MKDRGEDLGGGPTVARDRDPLVLALDPVDDVTEVVPDLAQRLNTHDTIVARWRPSNKAGHPTLICRSVNYDRGGGAAVSAAAHPTR